MPNLGKIMIIAGIILVIAGLVLYLAGDKLNWIGHLPGDIRVEKGNTRFYFPVSTMVVLSIILSVILWLIRKFFN